MSYGLLLKTDPGCLYIQYGLHIQKKGKRGYIFTYTVFSLLRSTLLEP